MCWHDVSVFPDRFLTEGILNTVSGYVLIPVQKGINAAGGWVRSRVDNLADLQQINEENQSLKEQVAEPDAGK